ncbi:hypothetical protein ACOMHN_040444 [Nucella lapillus]
MSREDMSSHHHQGEEEDGQYPPYPRSHQENEFRAGPNSQPQYACPPRPPHHYGEHYPRRPPPHPDNSFPPRPRNPGGMSAPPRNPGGMSGPPRGMSGSPRPPRGMSGPPRIPGGMPLRPRNPGGMPPPPRNPGGMSAPPCPRFPGSFRGRPQNCSNVNFSPRAPANQPLLETPDACQPQNNHPPPFPPRPRNPNPRPFPPRSANCDEGPYPPRSQESADTPYPPQPRDTDERSFSQRAPSNAEIFHPPPPPPPPPNPEQNSGHRPPNTDHSFPTGRQDSDKRMCSSQCDRNPEAFAQQRNNNAQRPRAPQPDTGQDRMYRSGPNMGESVPQEQDSPEMPFPPHGRNSGDRPCPRSSQNQEGFHPGPINGAPRMPCPPRPNKAAYPHHGRKNTDLSPAAPQRQDSDTTCRPRPYNPPGDSYQCQRNHPDHGSFPPRHDRDMDRSYPGHSDRMTPQQARHSPDVSSSSRQRPSNAPEPERSRNAEGPFYSQRHRNAPERPFCQTPEQPDGPFQTQSRGTSFPTSQQNLRNVSKPQPPNNPPGPPRDADIPPRRNKSETASSRRPPSTPETPFYPQSENNREASFHPQSECMEGMPFQPRQENNKSSNHHHRHHHHHHNRPFHLRPDDKQISQFRPRDNEDMSFHPRAHDDIERCFHSPSDYNNDMSAHHQPDNEDVCFYPPPENSRFAPQQGSDDDSAFHSPSGDHDRAAFHPPPPNNEGFYFHAQSGNRPKTSLRHQADSDHITPYDCHAEPEDGSFQTRGKGKSFHPQHDYNTDRCSHHPPDNASDRSGPPFPDGSADTFFYERAKTSRPPSHQQPPHPYPDFPPCSTSSTDDSMSPSLSKNSPELHYASPSKNNDPLSSSLPRRCSEMRFRQPVKNQASSPEIPDEASSLAKPDNPAAFPHRPGPFRETPFSCSGKNRADMGVRPRPTHGAKNSSGKFYFGRRGVPCMPMRMMAMRPAVRAPGSTHAAPVAHRPVVMKHARPAVTKPTAVADRGEEKGPVTKVFIGNISDRASDTMIQQLLQVKHPLLTKGFIVTISDRASHTMIRQLLQRCGTVLSWKRVLGSSGKLQAFGFCEYEQPSATLRCLRLLSGWKIADKKLIVKVDAQTRTILDNHCKKKKKKKTTTTTTTKTKTTPKKKKPSSTETPIHPQNAKEDSKTSPKVPNQQDPKDTKNNENKEDGEKTREAGQEEAENLVEEEKVEEEEETEEEKDRREREDRRVRATFQAIMRENLFEPTKPPHLGIKASRRDLAQSAHNNASRLMETQSIRDPTKEGVLDGDWLVYEEDPDNWPLEQQEPFSQRFQWESRHSSRRKERSRRRDLKRPRCPSPGSRSGSSSGSRSRSGSRDRGIWSQGLSSRKKAAKRKKKSSKDRKGTKGERRQARTSEEKERAYEEARQRVVLKEFLEDYEDFRDDPKFYKGYWLEQRRKEFERGREEDEWDRQQEKQEIEELKRRVVDGEESEEEDMEETGEEDMDEFPPRRSRRFTEADTTPEMSDRGTPVRDDSPSPPPKKHRVVESGEIVSDASEVPTELSPTRELTPTRDEATIEVKESYQSAIDGNQ